MSDIFYIDSASFQTFEVTNTATINNATVNGTLSVSRAIDGTSSYALSSVSSSYVSTTKTNTNAVYYPIFVDSNNSSPLYEQLYTDANAFLTYNPTTGSLTAKIFTNTISGQINNITTSYAITASYVLNAISSSYAATSSLAPNYVLNSATSSFVTNSQTSSFITNSQTSSMTVATASYVTGSVHNSTNPALSASFASTASRVISSNGSAFTIQYGGGASGILMTGSSNLQYNGTNITLNNGKIAQSDGTNYYLYLGKTGLVGANETGIWSYDTALDNTYPITSYDISTNKYYFANYQIIYDGASGRLGVGVSPTTAKLQVNGNVVATSFTGSISASNIDGTLPITKGGTGATTSTTAKSNIGFYDAYLINAQTTAAGVDTTINNISLVTQANEAWSFEFTTVGQCSGTGGVRFTVVYSSIPVSSSVSYWGNSTQVGNMTSATSVTTTPAQSATMWATATPIDVQANIRASFVNSGSANTVTIKVQPTNGAQTATLRAMTYITARRIS